MRIISKNEVRILAIHDDMIFMFSVDAIEGRMGLPKHENTHENVGKRLMGRYLDKNFVEREVLFDSKYHKMYLDAPDCVIVTQDRYDDLLASEASRTILINKIDIIHEEIFGKDVT